MSEWHLKKELTIGHIVTTIVVVASALLWVGKTESRITVLETLIVAEKDRRSEVEDRMISALRNMQRETNTRMDRLEQKIDRITAK